MDANGRELAKAGAPSFSPIGVHSLRSQSGDWRSRRVRLAFLPLALIRSGANREIGGPGRAPRFLSLAFIRVNSR